MRKQGPCFHCGIEKTPLWRNGPASKPVLCNACGSRYRLRGTLLDYTPKHLLFQIKSNNFPPFKKKKMKNKQFRESNDQQNTSRVYTASASASEQGYESSNKSSSSSESVTLPHTAETGDGNYPHPTVSEPVTSDGKILIQQKKKKKKSASWNVNVPSKKRSMVVYNSLSPIERLQKDLYKIQSTIIRNQDDDNDYGVLLYDNRHLGNHISPPEIGLGTMLLKPSTTQQ